MERNIIKIDEAGLKDDLKTLIRGTVEDTLNAMLDEEAASLCNAEMYLAGVSVRRVEDVTELLWGSRGSASTVSNLNQKVYGKIEEWLTGRMSHRQIHLSI